VRILRTDPTTGELRLRLETPSDLWRVARLVRRGDLVGASTTRRDPEAPEGAAAAERERRRVWLVVRAEQVEFHDFSRHVRVTGPIVEGPFDQGRYHTLDLAVDEDVALRKPEVTAADRVLLDEGRQAKDEARLLIACVDWGESSLVRLRGRALEPVLDLNRTLAGKRFSKSQAEKDRSVYLDELVTAVRRELPEAQGVVIAGPGFLKEELSHRLVEVDPKLRGRLKVLPTAEAGRAGVHELLRSGRAAEALQGSVAAEEAELVEQLLQALAGGRRAAVGIAEVKEATAQGAVETLLVSEGRLRSPEFVEVLDRVRSGRGRVLIVRDDGEAGHRLIGLGGVGGVLRYDWTPAEPRRTARAGG